MKSLEQIDLKEELNYLINFNIYINNNILNI